MVAWFAMHHAVNYILAFTDVSSAARSPNLSFSYGPLNGTVREAGMLKLSHL